MKKIVLVVILLAIILGITFLFLKNDNTNKASVQVEKKKEVQVSENSVSIKDFAFTPAVLNVKQGDTVTWINGDSTLHTVNSNLFDSPNLNTGDTFEFTFKDKGSFEYACGIHPSMKGQIVVE